MSIGGTSYFPNDIDIIKMIFGHLDAKDLARCSRVCTRFRIAANHESLWMRLCMRDFLATTGTKEVYAQLNTNKWKVQSSFKGEKLVILLDFKGDQVIYNQNGNIHILSETQSFWSETENFQLEDYQGISTMIFSDDLIIGGSDYANDDYDIRIWNMEGKRLSKLHIDSCGQTDALIKSGSSLIAGTNKFIRIWDLETEAHRELGGHESRVRTLNLSNNELISSSGLLHDKKEDRCTVKLWDLRTNAPIGKLSGNTNVVTRLERIQDLIICGSPTDNTIRIWDRRKLQVIRSMNESNGSLTGLAPAGNQLMSCSAAKTVRIWDLATGDCKKMIPFNQIEPSLMKRQGDTLLLGGFPHQKYYQLCILRIPPNISVAEDKPTKKCTIA